MDLNLTVYRLCEENKKLREFLISKGYDNLKDDKNYKLMGRMIKLSQALKMKSIDKNQFIEEYNNFLNGYVELFENKKDSKYMVAGAVPCPIKVPLFDLLNEFNKKNNIEDIDYDFRTANLGMEFLNEFLKGEGPSLVTSAGYDLIINRDSYNRLIKDYHAPDISYDDSILKRIPNIKDPNDKFFIMSMVPAVFIINKKVLGDRDYPKTWEELLFDDRYNNSLTIPKGDLDLFNAIVISIYSKYKEEGLINLKKKVISDLHPSQMVNTKNLGSSYISLAPYFFATLIRTDDLITVWPEDGAIVSPIFINVKNGEDDNIKSALDYFLSKEVIDTFSNNGKFPITIKSLAEDDNKPYFFSDWEILNNLDSHLDMICKYFDIR